MNNRRITQHQRSAKGFAHGMCSSLLKVCLWLLLLSTSAAVAADVNVLIIGGSSTVNQGDENSGFVPTTAQNFVPAQVKVQLQNILNNVTVASGIGTANVVLEDRTSKYSLIEWFYPGDSAVEATRWSNLRGEEGTDWDYVVVIGDPFVMEYMPGVYAHGVAKIAEQVALGGAETVLLMPWPGTGSASSIDHYKDIVYRTGRSGGLKVAPAGLAWRAAKGTALTNPNPDADGAYIAAASIFARIWGSNASKSTYSYGDGSLAATVDTAVTANIGAQQYTGKFNFQSAFKIFDRKDRVVQPWQGINSSSEGRLVTGSNRAKDRTGAIPSSDNYARLPGYTYVLFGRDYSVNSNVITFSHNFSWRSASTVDSVKAQLNLLREYPYSYSYFANSHNWRMIPWQILWSNLNQKVPSFVSIGATNHLDASGEAPTLTLCGTYIQTLASGRCPVDPPDEVVPTGWGIEYDAQLMGYQVAWQIGRCQMRAPGFKVMPSDRRGLSLRCGKTETMSVRFMLKPQKNVTVNVSITGSSAVTVSPSTLTFTPDNYLVPQPVTVTANAGQSAEGQFNVVYTTTSDDVVYNGLDDSWTYLYQPNRAPVAKAQTAWVVMNKAETITLSASDPDGQTLTYSIPAGKGPTVGTLNTTSGRTLVYTPATGSMAGDAFTFRVRDGFGGGATAIVTIKMVASNNEPVAEAGADKTVIMGSGDYPWTPKNENVGIWCDASDSSKVQANADGLVTTWVDKSGKGRSLRGTKTQYQPRTGTRTHNGLNVLAFDGVENHLRNESVDFPRESESMQNNINTFVVANIEGRFPTRSYLFKYSGDNAGLTFSSGSSSSFKGNISVAQGTTGLSHPFTGGPFTGPSLFGASVSYDEGAPQGPDGKALHLTVAGYVDGHTRVNKSQYSFPLSQMRNLRLFEEYAGWVGEFLAFGDLTAEQRQKVEGYLSHKWGLQGKLPSDHPYKAGPPIINAASVYLGDATANNGGDGMTLTTTWRVISAPSGSTVFFNNTHRVDATVTFEAVGTYVLQLKADDIIDQVYDTVTITVNPANGVTADAGADQTVTTALAEDADGSVALDGSGSSSVNGTIVSYSWSEDGTEIATGVNPTVTLTAGSHLITLTVTDDTAATATDTVTITVNRPPSVTAAATPTTVALSVTPLWPWTPAEITPAAWYDPSDASTITESAGAVSQWNDKSGNNNHAVQGTGSKKPTTGGNIGGLNALSFDSSAKQILDLTTLITNGQFDVFVVAKANSAVSVNADRMGIMALDSNSYNNHLLTLGTDNRFFSEDSPGNGFSSTAYAGSFQSNFLANLTYNKSGTSQYFINGTSHNSSSILADDISLKVIGAGYAGSSTAGRHWDGEIGEIIISNALLSEGNRQKTEGYLAHKWGLAANLPADHPYKSAAPDGVPAAQVNLLGTASDLDTGDTLTTTWTVTGGDAAKVSIANTSALNTTATFTAAGTYTLTLTADDGTAQRSDSVVITVNPANGVTSDAGADQTVTTALADDADGSITLDGSGSSTTNGAIVSYSWSEGGTEIATGVNPTVTLTAGSHLISLTVTDDTAATATDTVTITVNRPPSVTAAADPTTVAISGTSGPWTPADLTTAAWYDPSDLSTITESGGAVSQWNDKSGNNLHLSSSVGTPTVVAGAIGGRTALDFTSNSMTTASNPFGATISDAFVIAVHKVDAIENGTLFVLSQDPADNSLRYTSHAPWSGGGVFFDCGATTGDNRVSGDFGVSAGDVLISGFYGSVTDNVQQIYKNGALLYGDTNGHSVTTIGNMHIGGNPDSPSPTYQNTTIGEVVIINGTVSAADRQKLEGYLAHKWGLEANLPAGHPYKSAAPVNVPSAQVDLLGTAGDLDTGDTLTTTWTVTGGDAAKVSIANTSALNTTATFTAAGTYTLTLTADDGVAQRSDSVVITVTDGSGVTYTVTFDLDGKGTSSDTLVQTVNHGAAATAPTVTANTGWTFTGWDVAFDNVTSDLTVTAQYTAVPVTYTVTFDLDGKGTSSDALVQTVNEGAAATAPTVTANTGWTFTGWDVAFDNVTSDLTVTAQYTAVPVTYTVTFDLDGKGTSSDTLVQTVNEGAAATAPTVTANTGWTFTGWDVAFDNVTSDLTVTAQYTAVPDYLLTVVDGTGSGNYPENTVVPVGATIPANYHFVNWTGDTSTMVDTNSASTTLTMLASPMTVTANTAIDTYTVTFVEGSNGSRTGGGALVQTVDHGSAAVEPTITADTGWTFTGWDVAFNNVTSDLTVTAQYTAVGTTYTVTFDLDGKGTSSDTLVQTVNHGAAATAPTVTANTGWTFTSWDVAFDTVTSDLTVTAQYTAVGTTYTVTFDLDGKGTSSDTLVQTVNHGAAATAPTVTANTGWTFTSWDVAFDNVTSDLTVTAQYAASGAYTLTVNNGSGSGNYAEGASVAITATVAANYHFVNWTGDTSALADANSASTTVTMPASAVTVTANTAIDTYTVTFVEGSNGSRTGGGALVQTVDHGSAAVEPTITADTGWTFTGWDVAFDNVTSDLTVTAQYTAVGTTYTVTFDLDGKGTSSDTLVQTVNEGAAATAPTVTANTGWTFTGWDVAFDTVTSDLTVTAQYTAVGGGGGGGGGCNTSAATTANLLPLLLLLLGIGVMRRRNAHC